MLLEVTTADINTSKYKLYKYVIKKLDPSKSVVGPSLSAAHADTVVEIGLPTL